LALGGSRAALALLDWTEEAAAVLDELLQRKPGYALRYASGNFFLCADRGFVRRFIEGSRRAGTPE
jgi:hypothetical protein